MKKNVCFSGKEKSLSTDTVYDYTLCVCVCVCRRLFMNICWFWLFCYKSCRQLILPSSILSSNSQKMERDTKSRREMNQVEKQRWRKTSSFSFGFTFFDIPICLHNKQTERQKTLADVFSADSEVRKSSQKIQNFHNVLIPFSQSHN